MHVAIDGRNLQSQPPGGVGRSLHALLEALPGQGVARLDVLVDSRGGRPVRPLPSGVTLHYLSAPWPGGAVWLQTAVPRWLAHHRPDVFHCPFSGLPYRQPVPMVVTIYDLSFRDHPEWMSRRRRAAFRVQSRQAARSAGMVLTGSHHVAADIEARLGVPAQRISVASPTVDPVFSTRARPADVGPDPTELGRPYAVALGGSPRRRLPVAVAAWRRARDHGADLDLVVVGTEEPVAAPGDAGLIWAGPVPDTELARLLGGAEAFVYPTAYEGFGLPALEAAAAGAPVVAAPVGALPEVLGAAAEWVASPTPGPMADGLLRLHRSAARRHELSQTGRWQAGIYSDPDVAAAVVADAYRRAFHPR